MEQCILTYIPDRLKLNNRSKVHNFAIGEKIYRRCSHEQLENPFKTISLTELSHNRSGLNNNDLSFPDDVLYNISITNNFEIYNDQVVCELQIIDLNENFIYDKIFNEENNGHVGRLHLIHDPEICMYPHCIFRVYLNNELITYSNYSNTLKKSNVIRTMMKEELSSMIIRKEICQK